MGRINVLIVDDDVNFLYVLGLLLESKGLEVTSASRGAEAVDIVRKTTFDMVITDFSMPGMNGLELAAAVKELHPDLPVMMVTCEVTSYLIEMATDVGICRVLDKPVNVGRLLADIRHFSRRKGRHTPA
ncbi:response regulator [Geobacter anodireducens]